MDKAYNHNNYESDVYKLWEESGVMIADNTSSKPAYTIPMPPPNVTGTLHLGHATMLAIQDIMIRSRKMMGYEALWIPGTDHAAIATETKVIQHLGLKSREDMPRHAFLEASKAFAKDSHNTIVQQTKAMGAFADWSREAYTFDFARNQGVIDCFNRLYNDGLLYRGYRLINWSVGAQSVVSDDEVVWKEEEETLYYIRVGEFIISTARPETKCADSPVVVNPDDERYKHMIGKHFEYDTYAGTRQFYVLQDDCIDMNFGTGAMTISTAHDAQDYELATKYNLPFLQKIDFEGKMTAIAGECEGMTVKEARARCVEIMREKGLLVKEEKYIHSVPYCDRTKTVIEPMLKEQWFIDVQKEFMHPVLGKTTLKKLTLEAVENASVEIIPERFKKIYYHWIHNLRDWCISRQIWWGHQIPAWYDKNDKSKVYMSTKKEMYLIRHMESEANKKRVFEVGKGTQLTDDGRRMAYERALEMKDYGIQKIVHSGITRAKETAYIIATTLGITDIEEWNDISEVENKGLDGVSYDAFKSWKEMNEVFYEGNETDADIIKRAKKVLADMQTYPSKTLFISHAFFLNYLYREYHENQSDIISVQKQYDFHSRTARQIVFYTAPDKDNLIQDSDTLDTWFSSALWPLSTLGYPNNTLSADFMKFYPMTLLETGHDIIFTWVARMIMFGRYITGKEPFSTVYLHGMVVDDKGQKMSKSKGNGIDPLDVIDEYGADAVRLSLIIGTTVGSQIALSKAKIAGYRNFINKLWNAGRYIKMKNDAINSDKNDDTMIDIWLLKRYNDTVQIVNNALLNYDLSAAGDALYHFVWDDFCNTYLEISKKGYNNDTMNAVFIGVLKLLHPFTPYITEVLYNEVYGKTLIITEEYPVYDATKHYDTDDIDAILELLKAYKQAIHIHNGTQKAVLKGTKEQYDMLHNYLTTVQCDVVEYSIDAVKHDNDTVITTNRYTLYVRNDDDKSTKKIDNTALIKEIEVLQNRLNNEAYIQKAPKHLIDDTKKALEEKLDILKKRGNV